MSRVLAVLRQFGLGGWTASRGPASGAPPKDAGHPGGGMPAPEGGF